MSKKLISFQYKYTMNSNNLVMSRFFDEQSGK